MIVVKPYKSDIKKDWDFVLSTSTNVHFFFQREYIEYHSDRIKDASLVIYFETTPIAIFPCSQKEFDIISHGGLTFGGLIYDKRLKSLEVLDVLRASCIYFSQQGFKALFYKKIPIFYHITPTDSDEWALVKLGAQLKDISIGFVIDNMYSVERQSRRIRSIKKGIANKFVVKQSDDFAKFWDQILIRLLEEKYGTSPVHTIEEIVLLKNKFPENIKLFTIENEGEILAGTVLFINRNTVHTQYIGSSEEGKKNGANDLLYHYLITQEYVGARYFSFGTAAGSDIYGLQGGLVDWKEGFGARGLNHYLYYLNLEQL